MREDEPIEDPLPVDNLEQCWRCATIKVISNSRGDWEEVFAHVYNYKEIKFYILKESCVTKMLYLQQKCSNQKSYEFVIKLGLIKVYHNFYLRFQHLILGPGNLLQVHIGWAILEGKPIPSALILEFLLSPTAIAYDGSVNKVGCEKIGLFTIPITQDIVWVIGVIVISIIQGVLLHDNRLYASNESIAIQKDHDVLVINTTDKSIPRETERST